MGLAQLREVAEYPNSFTSLRPGQERIETERYTLCLEASELASTVQRQRFASAELGQVLAEVRSELRSRGRTRTQWEVGSSAQPAELVGMLLERGLVPDREPFAVALALTSAPPPPTAGLTARAVRTFEEYTAAKEVQWTGHPGRRHVTPDPGAAGIPSRGACRDADRRARSIAEPSYTPSERPMISFMISVVPP